MRTCPKCGAENRQAATECRLCATPLGSSAPPAAPQSTEARSEEQLAPTQIVSDRIPAAPQPEQKICPSCQTANEPDWLFCQSCGKKLSEDVQNDPAAEATPAKSDTAPQNQQQASSPSFGQSKSAAPNADRDTLKDLASRKPVELQDSADSEAPRTASPEARTSSSASEAQDFGNSERPEIPASGVCPKCGATSTPTGFFCANCGTKLAPAAEQADSAPAPKHVLQLITEGGQVGGAYPIESGELSIGRNEGDVTFPHDGYLSGKHARVVERGGRFFLVDNGSRNGTFVRIKGEVEIETGDTFLVGKQIFRLEKG